MNKNRWTVIALAALLGCGLALGAYGQTARPDAVKTADASRSTRLAWWREARFGLFIHWGPVSLTGKELSWSRANSNPLCPNKGETPVDVYDNLYKSFNPTLFNADEWAAIARDAGTRYVVFVAKHCDGFCLWPTATSDHNISRTPFRRDVCGELAGAVRRAGLRLGWYYSPMDWRDPDCRTAHNAAYVERMKGQVRELVTRYGRIDDLWFDWDGGTIPWDQESTYRLVRTAQPAIVLNNRLDCSTGGLSADKDMGPHADYLTPEQVVGAYNDREPWETCMTLGTQWSWKPNDKLKSVDEVIRILAQCAGGDGNLLLDVGPMPDGRIEPRQVAILREVGAWLKRCGESIYGTRGGPFKPGRYGASTRTGNRVYLHVFAWEGPSLKLPPIAAKVVASRVLGGGEASVRQTGAGLEIAVPVSARQSADTVVVLELDRPASGIASVDVPGQALK